MRVAWTGAAIAAALTEAIGLAAAFFPTAWLSLFSRDPQMIEVGSHYLRIVGPFYGFFGGGLALYFASQGAGRVARPMMFAVLRVVIAVGGGWISVVEFGGSDALFAVLAFALVFYRASATSRPSGAPLGSRSRGRSLRLPRQTRRRCFGRADSGGRKANRKPRHLLLTATQISTLPTATSGSNASP